MNGDDAARPRSAHIGLGDSHLLGKEILWLALESTPLLGQQHGKEAAVLEGLHHIS